MIACSQCGKELGGAGAKGSVAAISGGIMGDEYVESYYFCDACGVYTVEVFHDRFLGEGEAFLKGPISKSKGDDKVRLIGECPEPWDKECRCNAHRTYFEGSLD